MNRSYYNDIRCEYRTIFGKQMCKQTYSRHSLCCSNISHFDNRWVRLMPKNILILSLFSLARIYRIRVLFPWDCYWHHDYHKRTSDCTKPNKTTKYISHRFCCTQCFVFLSVHQTHTLAFSIFFLVFSIYELISFLHLLHNIKATKITRHPIWQPNCDNSTISFY